MAKKLNPDAMLAISAARKGNCKDAMKYLYDAAPHNQVGCNSPGFESAVSDFRHASVIVSGSCARPNASKSARHDQQGFDGPRRRKRR